jgi:hypothetical protein
LAFAGFLGTARAGAAEAAEEAEGGTGAAEAAEGAEGGTGAAEAAARGETRARGGAAKAAATDFPGKGFLRGALFTEKRSLGSILWFVMFNLKTKRKKKKKQTALCLHGTCDRSTIDRAVEITIFKANDNSTLLIPMGLRFP